MHQQLSIQNTYPGSCILGSPQTLSNSCDSDMRLLDTILFFLHLQSQLLRHLQSSVTRPFFWFNLHYMSHYSRVLNFPFLLSSDQSTSSRKGNCVIQLLYSSYLLHNIFTFFRSHKHIKLLTLPNFHVSGKKKTCIIQRPIPDVFSSLFSPFKYETASNIKARHSSTGSWQPKFSQESLR